MRTIIGTIERNKTEIPCPYGKRIELSYKDWAGSKRQAKCRRCKSSFKFISGDQSRFRFAIRDLERSQKKIADTMKKVIANADIIKESYLLNRQITIN